MVEDVGSVRQQIGEILGTVRSLSETLKEFKEDRVRQEERISAEIRNIDHRQRQSDQVIAGKMELLSRQFGDLDTKVRSIFEELAVVKKDVALLNEVKRKVDTLRERVIIYMAAIGSVVAAAWYFLGPFLSNLFQKTMSK